MESVQPKQLENQAWLLQACFQDQMKHLAAMRLTLPTALYEQNLRCLYESFSEAIIPEDGGFGD